MRQVVLLLGVTGSAFRAVFSVLSLFFWRFAPIFTRVTSRRAIVLNCKTTHHGFS
jgi:hypothetical protein